MKEGRHAGLPLHGFRRRWNNDQFGLISIKPESVVGSFSCFLQPSDVAHAFPGLTIDITFDLRVY